LFVVLFGSATLYSYLVLMHTLAPQEQLLKNVTAYIDPRWKDQSLAEGKLAEIIPLCWATNQSERASIFEIVALLRDALKEVKEAKENS
jgi:hypothetical protein